MNDTAIRVVPCTVIEKLCTRCGLPKKASEFGHTQWTDTRGPAPIVREKLQPYCIPCTAAYNTERVKMLWDNPGSVTVHYLKAPMSTRTYSPVLCAQCGGSGRRQYGIARERRTPAEEEHS